MEKSFCTTGNKCGDDSRMQTRVEMSLALAPRRSIFLQLRNAVFFFSLRTIFLVFKMNLAGVWMLTSHHSK